MAKYQKYAEYKASGFKAFGQIPNHWDVLNLRYVFDFLNEKRFPLSSLERAEKKGQYPANSNMRCDSLKSLMIINKLSKFL